MAMTWLSPRISSLHLRCSKLLKHASTEVVLAMPKLAQPRLNLPLSRPLPPLQLLQLPPLQLLQLPPLQLLQLPPLQLPLLQLPPLQLRHPREHWSHSRPLTH